MARPKPLSGFPEWLPAERLVERHVIDTFERVCELHGFAGIETRAVEPLSELLRKGETSKEVYLLHRLQDDDTTAERDPEKQLGLHFDLTVPLARYVLENAGHLVFPFKRYQIQKVWRGERPQDGRFREFYQADIDVVGDGVLPLQFDAELPLVMADALAQLPLPGFTIHINNRKVSEGFYRGLGIGDVAAVLRAIDKLPKIGAEAVTTILCDDEGLTAAQAAQCLALAEITGADASVVERVRALGVTDDLLDEGLAELGAVLEQCGATHPGVVVADLSIARGLDYYTGTVYETFVHGHENLGSICSGGRYDRLASDGKRTYPGVGLSIGLSRLVSRILSAGLASASRPVPTAVLVAVTDEAHRAASARVADVLRSRGIASEVAPTAAKFGKQIKYADRRGIPYVWFCADPATTGDDGENPPAGDSVKDIRSGEQVQAEAATWKIPADDLLPRIIASTPETAEKTAEQTAP